MKSEPVQPSGNTPPPEISALSKWKKDVGGTISAPEGNAFMDGYYAGVAASSKETTTDCKCPPDVRSDGAYCSFCETRHAEATPSPATKENKGMKSTVKHTESFEISISEHISAELGPEREEALVSTMLDAGLNVLRKFGFDTAWRGAIEKLTDAPSPAREETPCQHERLDEDGYCRRCGADMRSGVNLSDTQTIAELRQMVAVLQAQIAEADAGARSVVVAPQTTHEDFETAASKLEGFKYHFQRAMVRGVPIGEYLDNSTFNAWTGWKLALAGVAALPSEEETKGPRCESVYTEDGSTFRCAKQLGHGSLHEQGNWEWWDEPELRELPAPPVPAQTTKKEKP